MYIYSLLLYVKNTLNPPVEITSKFNGTVLMFDCALNSSIALTSTGYIYSWGDGYYGTLADGSTSDNNIPYNNTIYWGFTTGETLAFLEASYHGIAVTTTGRVLTWGYNDYGQLGDNSQVQAPAPAPIDFPIYTTVDSVVFTEYNAMISVYTPERVGYVFNGWYLDKELTVAYVFGTMPAYDFELYASWVVE
ncbi:MAG: InlB B-repeat-containing protein [Tenericutes bacterium]|nr:InlB B-repeat-containing protein [Mycoplasmatota bacterium]